MENGGRPRVAAVAPDTDATAAVAAVAIAAVVIVVAVVVVAAAGVMVVVPGEAVPTVASPRSVAGATGDLAATIPRARGRRQAGAVKAVA